jgi:pimeloyl-ACP methyl ester carboxylesterase
VATLEARMDDIRAVMDDVGTARAVIMGDSEGGPLAALFAATYPERVAALILYGTSASDVGRSDYPWPPPYAARLRQIDDDARTIHRTWGTPEGARALLEHFAPSVADDAAFRRYFTTAMRLGASPGAVIALRRMNLDLDVRHILPAIRVPTLVLQRTGDRGTHPGEGRYLAARIPGARLVELPGDDHFAFVGDMEGLIATIAPFVVAAGATGVAGEGDEPDRVLTTVLAAAPTLPGVASVPPSLRERFGALARGECAGHGGRRVTVGATTLLATFDGPARAIRCARALVRGADGLGLALRVALHTGECDRCDDRARGPAVDVAAGLVGQAEPGMVLVSGVVKDLVAGSGLTFTAYSVQHLAGGPNIWPLYAVD